MDYFISDTHFGHSKVLEFERTQFKNIEEHDNFILDLLQSKLTKGDRLIHLGDFGNPTQELLEKWNRLNCRKILIRGNHDNQVGLVRLFFNHVQNEPWFYKKRILLSHEPLPVTKGTINVHGHLHNADLDFDNYHNISIHVIGYKLISNKDLENMLISLPKDNFKFKQEWFAEHYRFFN